MAGRKTTKYTMNSGYTPFLLSGAITPTTAFSVDGSGRLRQLTVAKGNNSGVVYVSVYADSGLIVENASVAMDSGAAMVYADLLNTSVGSGSTLISGVVTITAYQPIEFSENLTVRYGVTSGYVVMRGVVEVDKRLIT